MNDLSIEEQENLILKEKLNKMTSEQQLIELSKSGYYSDLIKYIDNPSEEVQLASISVNYASNFQYIKNPTQNVKLKALKNSPDNIIYIKNPNQKEIKQIIIYDYKCLKYLDPNEINTINENNDIKISKENQLSSIKRNQESIKLLLEIDEENQDFILKNYKKYVKDIKNPSNTILDYQIDNFIFDNKNINNIEEKFQIKLMNNNPNNIHLIRNPSEKVIIEAIARDGKVLQLIENYTPEMIKLAIEENGEVISLLKKSEITPELEMLSVSMNKKPNKYKNAIDLINNPKIELIKKALEVNYSNIKLIDNFHKLTIEELKELTDIIITDDNFKYKSFLQTKEKDYNNKLLQKILLLSEKELSREEVIDLNLLDSESQIKKIKETGKNNIIIKYIENPSLEVQEYSINNGRNIIKYINNLDENIQLKLIKKNIKNYEDIKNPSKKAIKLYTILKNNKLSKIIKQ